jgi:hypothetical protein
MTLVSLLHILAAEGPKNANIWNPTIIGILTVASAIGLFCGSAYLLLATNLGGRLGFLIAAAGLSAFMLLLTTLWWSSGSSGIDPPHGRSPSWVVVDTAASPASSKIKAVQNIATKGKAVGADELVNLKPAIDAAIVPATSVNGETPPSKPFATLGYSSSTDYIADFPGFQSYAIGGGTKNIFWHNHQYAAVQLCTAKPNSVPPVCDPLAPVHYVILSRNLGTLRQPTIAYWFASVILFVLSLLGLHWYEQDQRERKKASLAPVPVPGA